MSFYPDVSEIYIACRWIHLHYHSIPFCIYRENYIIHAILWCGESSDCNKDQYDWWNAVCVWNSKNHWCENMAPSLPQSLYSSLSSSQSLPQTGAAVSAAPQFDYFNTHSCGILNAPQSLKVLWGACEHALAHSESTLPSSKEGCEHLGVLGRSGEGYQSVWEVCVWLRDRITFRWCSILGSPILVVPNPSCRGFHFSVDYRHLNDDTTNDQTTLPIMEKLHSRLRGDAHITKVNQKSGFHWIHMQWGPQKCISFRTISRLYESMVMPFALCNAPGTFQRPINWILWPLLGIELVKETIVHADKEEGIVVVAYINGILIATKRFWRHIISKFWSLFNHLYRRVSDLKSINVFSTLLNGWFLDLS
jgi:hypothetical protein